MGVSQWFRDRTQQERDSASQRPVVALGLYGFIAVSGVCAVVVGAVSLRAGSAPSWLSWALVAVGVVTVVRTLADAWRLRRSPDAEQSEPVRSPGG